MCNICENQPCDGPRNGCICSCHTAITAITGRHITMKRFGTIWGLLGLILGLLGLTTACSAGGPDSYEPYAYGVPGHCYYVSDPAESRSRASGTATW